MKKTLFIILVFTLLFTLSGCTHEHEYTEEVVAPTCTESGYTIFTCECGQTHNGLEVDALGHSFSEWTITKEATFEEKGSKERECSVCKEKEVEEIPVNNNGITITIKYEDKEENIKIEKGTIVGKEMVSLLDQVQIEGLYYDDNYSNKYENEQLFENTTLYLKIKEIVITYIFEYKKGSIKLESGTIFDISLIKQNIDEYDVEGIYWDKEYTNKYTNEKLYDDAELYLKRIVREYTFDTLTKEQEETIKADYQKKYLSSHKDATLEDVKIMYYVGTYNGCVIAMYTHTWHSNFDFPFSEEITDGYGIGYNIDNCLLVWKDNQFMRLKEAYEKGYIDFDDFLDLKYRYKYFRLNRRTILLLFILKNSSGEELCSKGD